MQQQNRTKNELFIGATVQPIQNCQLLASCEDSTLFVSKRSLIIMNLSLRTLKSCLIEQQKIISATYYQTLQIFIVNTDRYLIIINKQAQIISKQRIPQLLQAKQIIILTMEDGYEGVYGKRKDQILYLTNQYIFQVTILIQYQRSLLKNKSLSQIKIQFVSKPQIVHFQWTSNYKYLQRLQLLICWNQSQTFVFQTPKTCNSKISLIHIFDKIMKRNKLYESDNKINAFQASMQHRLLIAAFQLGSIKIYKLDQTKKYVCQLKGHQKQCTGLYIPQQTPDLLYSCGLDNCIRIWDLLDFGQVYHVRFDIICSRIGMLNQKLVFAKSIDNRRSFFIKFNIGLLKPILSQAKNDRLINLVSDGQWCITLYSNNYIQGFLLGEQYNNQGRQFTQKIQFPMKYGFLRSTVKIKQQNYAICMQKGFSIIKLSKKQSQSANFELKRLVYNHTLQSNSNNARSPNQKGNNLIEMIHQKLLDTYFFTILQDWKNIPIAINVTAVNFLLNKSIPKWDIQSKAKYDNNKKSDYVLLGSDRGYIYFVDIKKKSHYHARVYFHSNPVSTIDQINFNFSHNSYYTNQNIKQNSNTLYFISTTVDQQIVIWQLSQEMCPKVHYRFNYTRDITVLKPVDNCIGIGCKSGQFSIFQIRLCQNNEANDLRSSTYGIINDNSSSIIQQHNLYESTLQFYQCTLSTKSQGHLKSIISIDCITYRNNQLWLSAGQDYSIKIWRGVERQLLIQVRIFSMINCAIFAKRDMDIIISHGENGQISVMSSKYIVQLDEVKQQLEKINTDKCVMMKKIKFREFMCPIIEEVPSPRKKQKQWDKLSKQGSNRKQLDQLIKKRSINKGIELMKYPLSDRKQLLKKQPRISPTKNLQLQQVSLNHSTIHDNSNQSIHLPKLPKISKNSFIFGSAKRYDNKQLKNQSTVLEKISTPRTKSYSHAGRLNL